LSSSGPLEEETKGRNHSTASPYLTCGKGSSEDNQEDRKENLGCTWEMISLDLDEGEELEMPLGC